MANLIAKARDVGKVQEGEWRRLFLDEDPAQDGMILTKGIDDAYRDALNRRLSKIAKAYHGNTAMIPTAALRKIDIDLHVERLFLDVRNVQGADGQDLGFEAFCDILYDPAYLEVWHLASAAAAAVGNGVEEMKEEAEKN